MKNFCRACHFLLLIIWFFTPIASFAKDTTSYHGEVMSAIKEFNNKCASKNWLMWGETLCGPLLFVEPNARELYASEPDKNGKLNLENGLYRGILPDNVAIANTAKEWSGVRWSMLMLPLPKNKASRLTLLAHESFHRIQPLIKLNSRFADNSHLSNLEGRFWLLLELKALSLAIMSEGKAVNLAVEDALRFRAVRYKLYPEARANEETLEINEGLAELTGILLNQNQKLVSELSEKLASASKLKSLERSFAYLTGPSYGLIINKVLGATEFEKWIKSVNSEFSFFEAINRVVFTDSLNLDSLEVGVEKLRDLADKKYGGNALWGAEKSRALELESRHEKLVRKFVDGRTLKLPLKNMKMNFDPDGSPRNIHIKTLEAIGEHS